MPLRGRGPLAVLDRVGEGLGAADAVDRTRRGRRACCSRVAAQRPVARDHVGDAARADADRPDGVDHGQREVALDVGARPTQSGSPSTRGVLDDAVERRLSSSPDASADHHRTLHHRRRLITGCTSRPVHLRSEVSSKCEFPTTGSWGSTKAWPRASGRRRAKRCWTRDFAIVDALLPPRVGARRAVRRRPPEPPAGRRPATTSPASTSRRARSRSRRRACDCCRATCGRCRTSARSTRALSWGNSFGYITPEDTARSFAGLRRVVRPGGTLVLESGTIAESLLPRGINERSEHEFGGITMRQHAHATGRARAGSRATSVFEADGTVEHGARGVLRPHDRRGRADAARRRVRGTSSCAATTGRTSSARRA